MRNLPKTCGGICGVLVAIAVLGISSGCGSGTDHISGTVTYEDEPVPYGKIIFEPDTKKGNSGPTVEAEIIDGKYDTSKSGKVGVSFGPMIVKIQGYDGVPGGLPKSGQPPRPPPKDFKKTPGGEPDVSAQNGNDLFGQYETKIDISKGTTTQDFVVP